MDTLKIYKERHSSGQKKKKEVFPEFEGNGYGAWAIRIFQSRFRNIIAESVRTSARGFWQKMGWR